MKEIKTYRDLMKVLSEGYTVEYKSIGGDEWFTVEEFDFHITTLEFELIHRHRIKTTKPSINWEHVHPRFNYLARDNDGGTYLYEKEPHKRTNQWTSDNGDVRGTRTHSSLTVGNCHWTESLVKRPEE